jgi:2'-5' RNA ligase
MVGVEGDVADSVSELASLLCRQNRLTGTPRPKGLLHATLCCIGSCAGMPDDFRGRVELAARSIGMRPFVAQFEYVMNFGRGAGRHPIVLVGEDGVIGFQLLWEELRNGLGSVGLGRHLGSSCTPHITLIYDRHPVGERYVQPVRWVVNEFALVCSLVGRSRHIRLGQWPLTG